MRPLVCLMLFFLVQGALSAQSSLIKMSPIDKHHFRITNQCSFNLAAEIGGFSETISLPASQSLKLPLSARVLKNNYIQLKYPEEDYRNDLKKTEANIKSQLEFPELWEEVEELTEGLNTWADYSAILRQNGMSTGLISAYQQRFQARQLFAASQGEEKNEYSREFERHEIRESVQSNLSILPKVHIEYSFALFKSALSDFWGKKSSRWSHGVSMSLLVLDDVRLGKTTDTYLGLNVFGDWSRISYGLAGISSQNYYVDAEYVKFAEQGVFPLSTTKNINLNFKTASFGSFARILIGRKLMFDIGIGYAFNPNAELQFDKKGDNDEEITHLMAPEELKAGKFKQVIEASGGVKDHFFGIGKVGIFFNDYLTVAISSRIAPTPSWQITDNYQLYYNQPPQVEPLTQVPINTNGSGAIDLQFRLSVGMAMGRSISSN